MLSLNFKVTQQKKSPKNDGGKYKKKYQLTDFVFK